MFPFASACVRIYKALPDTHPHPAPLSIRPSRQYLLCFVLLMDVGYNKSQVSGLIDFLLVVFKTETVTF